MSPSFSCKPSAEAPGPGQPGAATPAAPAAPTAPAAPADLTIAADLAAKVARQVPVRIDFDEGLLTAQDRQVLKKLAEAALIMDQLFLLQVDEGNPALRGQLAADPARAEALTLFDMMAGPWDRLDGDKPFVGARPKPPGAAFYPPAMTKEAFQAHLQAHPEEKEAFTGYFSVIREQEGRLKAIPYSVFYKEPLEQAARLLEEAAALAGDERLKRYLTLRAKAFRTDDYVESDMAWMDLGDGKIEVVIGPYEVYEDGLFGYKAAFESFLALRDPADSARLASIMQSIPALEKKLPLPEKYVVAPRGMESPLSVVVLVLSAGDTKAGVQTLAFNLPNDEKVRQAKGSKKVMLRNVAEAKFAQILLPIALQMIVEEQVADITFEAFFNHTLLHETAHGMGPGVLTLPDGSKSEVGRELKDLYSFIEEAKADMLGLWGTHQLVDMGLLPKALEKQAYAATLAGLFRSLRFGIHEAHGKANLIQYNWLLRHGAIERLGDGRYRVDYGRARPVVEELARQLLIVEAEG
ncbi:MAG: peptidase, partial [Deltaproteobacteria bacterium]|nr:peptidase [Deltaproteobacteria bacterium]